MAQLLRFVPDWGSPLEERPRVRSARFGDGYEQRGADGLNTILQRWQFGFSARTKAVADEIAGFLRAHEGRTAFDVKVPDRSWVASDDGIGVGDGSRSQFALQLPGMTARSDDWRGEWPVYKLPRTNLIRKSGDLSAAPWSPSACTVTPTQDTAPDGTRTAARVETAQTAFAAMTQNTGVVLRDNSQVTFSIWLKAFPGEVAYFSLGIRDHTSGGTVWMVLGTDNFATSVGDQWTRVSISCPGTPGKAVGVAVYLGGLRGTANFTRMLMWGAQLEVSAAATRYIPNTSDSASATESPAILPDTSDGRQAVTRWTTRPTLYRRTYGGAIKQRLTEQPRQNMVRDCNDLTTANWNKNLCTVTANAGTSPDGAVTADKIIPDATSSTSHGVGALNSYGATTTGPYRSYTFSVFLAAAGYGWATVGVDVNPAGGDPTARVNLSTGAVESASASSQAGVYDQMTVAVEKVGCFVADGPTWWRVSITFRLTAAAGTGFANQPFVYANSLSTGAAFSGDLTSGILMWGAQFEETAFAGLLIPTGASPASHLDCTLEDSGLATLTTAPLSGEAVSFDGAGDVVKSFVCRGVTSVPRDYGVYDVQAEFEEVAG